VSRLNISDLAILLIEPSLTQSKIMVRQLAEVGNHNVESVNTPEAAWKTMQRVSPDLVISAMYFDQSTGAELVQRMRAEPRLADVPFMLVSSEKRWASLEPIKQAGVMAILPKPFAIEDLTMALQTVAEFVDADGLEAEDMALDAIRVLVVDDSLTARRHIMSMLEKSGLEQISSANDGQQAVKLMEESIFDLVITDYNMPVMDGAALIDHIRNHSTQASVPIIMITSENNEARLDAVLKSGVSAICDKPFDMKAIKALIHQMVVD
jgi:two-component system chemotaxis response regulator CheY